MKLIVGLGNPGTKYKYTRHNVGFLVLDSLSEDLNLKINSKNFQSLSLKTTYENEDTLFIKPQTFMNNSGEAVQAAMTFHKINPSDMIVIHDDVDLPFGSIRVKEGGGTAGHKGLNSIVGKIGSDFIRIRIGVGRSLNPHKETCDHVLENFNKEDLNTLADIIQYSIKALKLIIIEGSKKAMNEINSINLCESENEDGSK